jgi:hypothetical protein
MEEMKLTVGQNLSRLVELGPELGLAPAVDGLVRFLRPEQTPNLTDVHPKGLVELLLLLLGRLRPDRLQRMSDAVRLGSGPKSIEVDEDAIADVDDLPRTIQFLL